MPRSPKLALVFLLGYLAPADRPDPRFHPAAWQLDDTILVVVVLRFVLR
jgi:hypothetical protein